MRRLAPLIALLAVVCSGCWLDTGASPWHGGYNPTETNVNAGTWSGLHPAWTAPIPAGNFIGSNPAVFGGVAYEHDLGGTLRAFDVATGAPLWTAAAGGGESNQPPSDPAVDGHTVFVGGADGTLYAFDASGTRGCSGTPKVCAPLWTARLGGSVYSPTITGTRIFVGSSNGNFYALDEAAGTSCSGVPKVCTPLWSATTGVQYNIGALQAPAVDDDFDLVVYPGPHALFAFDATGNTNCSGVPKVCTPQWRADFGSSAATVGYPVIAGRIVYQALLNATWPRSTAQA